MDKKKMIGDIVTSITDKELKKDYFYNAVPLAVILGKDAKKGHYGQHLQVMHRDVR